MELRPYQREAVNAVYHYYRNGNSGHPLIALPTGTGKAMSISALISEILNKNPKLRIVMLVDTKELVEQNALEMEGYDQSVKVAVCCAGLGRNEISQVTFGSIQSVAKRYQEFGHIDVVVIDEVQGCDTSSETMYSKFLNGLMEVNPKLRVIGFSATLWRQNMGYLTAEGSIFTDIVYDKTIGDEFLYFIEEGYLVDVISKQTVTQLDVSGVKITRGDFNAKQLQEAVDKNEVTYAALCEALPYMQLRNSIIVFGSGIQHCLHITEMLNDEFDIPSVCVHSKLTDAERDDAISGFKTGRYKAIVNDNILTKGFNHKGLDLMIDLSPTTSSSRFVQKVGRITRPLYADGYSLLTREGRLQAIAASPKPNALLLDYASNTMRCGQINNPKIPKQRGEGSGEAPIKACPKCLAIIPASKRVCGTYDELQGVVCDYEFEFKTKVQVTASSKSVIAKSSEPEYEWYDVKAVSYTSHKSKKSDNIALKVTYSAGIMFTFTEYVSIEGKGRYYASQWWSLRQQAGMPILPQTVAEALLVTSELLTPKRIYVRTDERYPKIESYEF